MSTGTPSGLLSQQILLPTRVTCPAHLILLDLIAKLNTGVHKSRAPSR